MCATFLLDYCETDVKKIFQHREDEMERQACAVEEDEDSDDEQEIERKQEAAKLRNQQLSKALVFISIYQFFCVACRTPTAWPLAHSNLSLIHI